MDHYAPHSSASFEGYYSKFRLPSGSSIALIVSTVPTAARALASSSSSSHSRDASKKAKNPYAITFTYVSPDGGRWWQREYFPSNLSTRTVPYGGGVKGFEISWDRSTFAWIPAAAADDGVDTVSWNLDTPELRFSARTTCPHDANSVQKLHGGRTPWDPGEERSTPAGWMASLPLPIQWHVHSLDSYCSFSLDISPSPDSSSIDTLAVPKEDREGMANVHIEKNWAVSFPTSYIWVQARDHSPGPRGICLAGGALFPGVEAYLVTYHSPMRIRSFAPPTSVSLPIPFVPWGLASHVSWNEGAAIIDIRGWWTRLRVSAVAPPDTFFTLAAPLSHGHEEDYTAQSFAAKVQVEVWERSTWGLLTGWTGSGGWRILEDVTFERGSLEMGGTFYKPHTS